MTWTRPVAVHPGRTYPPLRSWPPTASEPPTAVDVGLPTAPAGRVAPTVASAMPDRPPGVAAVPEATRHRASLAAAGEPTDAGGGGADARSSDPLAAVWHHVLRGQPVDVPREVDPPGIDEPGAGTRGGLTWDVARAIGVARTGYGDVHGRSSLDTALGGEPDAGDERAHAAAGGPLVRWAMSWRLAAAAATVVVVLAGLVAIRASTRAAGPPVTFAAPAASTPAESPAPADDTAVSPAPREATDTVLVHVVGAVAAAGVVDVPAGSRVADAIDAAGGAAPDADLSTLNLARVVTDGEQVVVLRLGEQPPAAAASPDAGAGTSSALVDLNTADAAALDALPGIGPVLAERIVQHRQERPFASVDELADVRGIGTALLEGVRELVRV